MVSLTRMSPRYSCTLESDVDGVVTVNVGFGEPSTNEQIVPDAVRALEQLNLKGGRGIKFNGHASLPVAMALAHAVAHLFGFVAVFDPKLQKYVVAVSHNPELPVGALIE